MKVAIAQIEPDYMSKEGSIDRAVKAIEEAGKKGAKIIAFPETFIPGYPYWRGFTGQKWADYMLEYQRNSVRLPQDLSLIMEAAKEGNINVVLGVSELEINPEALPSTTQLLSFPRRESIWEDTES